jgi:CBS domain containing-hemolysin-like protein
MSDPDPASTVPAQAPREGLIERLKSLFSTPNDNTLSESVADAIDTHHAQNPGETVRAEAKSMMLKLIEFADLRVDDVMVLRADIVAIEDSASVRELLERIMEANHSRIPVYRETLDDISGMLHIKDLMRWMSEKGTKRRKSAKDTSSVSISLSAGDLATTVKEAGIVRDVLFVPPSMPAADLLMKMQSSHIHIAIVVDEYGGTDGLVSIEDLVEEIVGDISDEHDTDDDDLIRDNGDGTYTADARVDLEELETLLGFPLLPEERKEDAETLGGLLFSMFGRVPVRGELLRHDSGIEFRVLDADARRVKRIKIHTKPKVEPPAGE